jgi:hypothetical protein
MAGDAPALQSSADRHSIMPSPPHSCDKRFGFRKNHRLARIVAGELLRIIHGIKTKQRNEFHFIAIFMNEQSAPRWPLIFRAAMLGKISSRSISSYALASAGLVHPCQMRAIIHLRYGRTRPQLAGRGGCAPFPCFDYHQEQEEAEETVTCPLSGNRHRRRSLVRLSLQRHRWRGKLRSRLTPPDRNCVSMARAPDNVSAWT